VNPTGGVQFKVTPDALMQASADCSNTNVEIQTQLQALKAYVVSLEPAWQGSAAIAFNELMIDFDVNANLLNTALSDMSNALVVNAQNYSDSDGTNAKNMLVINGELGGSVPPANFS
jgi:WXG100 family type VII secretion target